MVEQLEVEGGMLAYEATGEGPLVVMVPGMGTGRSAYRFLAPRIAAAGHRVVVMDLRGVGDSTIGWPSYTRGDTARDIIALIRHLGEPAVVVGNSFSGGSATIAAAQEPDLVRAVVELGPFTREQKTDVGCLLRNAHHRKGMMLLLATSAFRSPGLWRRYLDHAHPGRKPDDFAAWLDEVVRDMSRPGRMAALSTMGMAPLTEPAAHLGRLNRPALVVMGTHDPDWSDPRAEAHGIVAGMPDGIGQVVMIEGAGHYPQAQYPDEVADAILTFLKERVHG